MPVHFDLVELAGRRDAVLKAMATSGLDGLLMFRQESMYYLTGYDTFGFSLFQCLYLHGDGRLTLLTRAPDLRQAQHTSVIEDIRIWVDAMDAAPAQDLRRILEEYGTRGACLGIEFDAYGLNARHWRSVEAALAGFCELQDASSLVSRLRAVKSDAELACVQRAAALADDALDEAIRTAVPGAFEGDILAAMQGAVFRGGGDYAGNEFIIGSGAGALLCRYFSGRRHLDADDQLTLEFAGAWRRYHAALMRTILIGAVSSRHRAMHVVCVDALNACMEAIRPGRPMGDVFDAHARVVDAAGLGDHRLNACGYGMGAVYNPLWVDPPMFHEGNDLPMQENNVFFLHMILMDSDHGAAMTLGHTVRVTATGCEALSRHGLDLIVNP